MPNKNAKHVFNPHLAGLYATTVYLLKDKLDSAKECWEYLLNASGKTTSTRINNSWKNLNEEQKNLLSHVAYTNRYRFVTIERPEDKRSGGKDRTWLNKDKERELLLSEIEIFKPDIIVFQGKAGLDNCNTKELKKKYTVFEANHPSCWQKRANKLEYIKETFDK